MHHAAIGYTDIESESIASAVGLMPQSKKIITNIAICGCYIVVCTSGETFRPPRHWHNGTGLGVSGSQLWWCWQLQSQILDHEPDITVLLC